jgi:cell division protein FtsI/penicillin-binding protein 2
VVNRVRVAVLFLIFCFLLVIARLFYWQIIRGKELAARGLSQYFYTLSLPAMRGEILATDGSVLAGSKPSYLLYAYKPNFSGDFKEVSSRLSDLMIIEPDVDASPLAKSLDEIKRDYADQIFSKLFKKSFWEILVKRLDSSQKNIIDSWHVPGLGFQYSWSRFYPEASSGAHIMGFVGQDASSQPKGYFGLEGYYERELKGLPGSLKQEKDVYGNPILVGNFSETPAVSGRIISTHIDKYVQTILETELLKGIERYGAAAGEAVLMDPGSGALIAQASYPNYNPENYWAFDQSWLKNPVISESYEPGSTFKTVVMAAALDSGVVEPDTKCDICSGPISIGPYSIGTWDGKYHPEIDMTDTIIHSDNTGMVFAARRLGNEKFMEYIKKFGFGNLTGIDLQGETSPNLRPELKDIDLATTSFGQGIAVTTIQMLRAVAAIANGGVMETPIVADKIGSDSQNMMPVNKKSGVRVISKEASDKLKEMMVKAVVYGEAKFAAPKGYRIAGKTGTAQIPVSGHYDKEKTIASFVGFAPADNPKFVMIVKLREPTSSQWGSETAAPLWFNIAKKLLLYWEIPQ